MFYYCHIETSKVINVMNMPINTQAITQDFLFIDPTCHTYFCDKTPKWIDAETAKTLGAYNYYAECIFRKPSCENAYIEVHCAWDVRDVISKDCYNTYNDPEVLINNIVAKQYDEEQQFIGFYELSSDDIREVINFIE